MKINAETRFPYPVLNAYTGDYKTGAFTCEIDTEEDVDRGQVRFKCDIAITEEKLKKLIAEKKAQTGVYISCEDTYYSKLHELRLDNSIITLPEGSLYGRVVFKPFVWAPAQIVKYANENLNKEFGSTVFDFDKGSVLAMGDETYINVGHDKFLPMQSIFNLALDESLSDGVLNIVPEDSSILIRGSQRTLDSIDRMITSELHPYAYSCVYLPAVMEVLSCMEEDPDGSSSFSDTRWYSILKSKCEGLDIDLNDKEGFMEKAQKLLQWPFGRILLKENNNG